MSVRYEKMPNGQLVAVPEDISPEAFKRVQAKYTDKPTTRSEAKAQGQPRKAVEKTTNIQVAPKSEQRTRIDARKAEVKNNSLTGLIGRGLQALPESVRKPVLNTGMSVARAVAPASALMIANEGSGNNLLGGGALNFDDEAKGAVASVKGIPKAIKERSLAPIAEEYRLEQRAQDEIKRDYARDNPGSALAAQALGSVALPFAGTGRTAFAGAQALRKVGSTGLAKGVGRTAARMRASGPISRGVTTGAVLGAGNAAGMAENLSSVPSNLIEGGVVGGAFGGVLGGLVRGGTAVARAVGDRGKLGEPLKEANKARAYQRVGSLIDNIRGIDDKPVGAKEVIKRIGQGNATGADTRLMDQSSGLRAEAAFLGRETNLPNSNRLQELAEDRIAARQGNFGDEVSQRATTSGADARDLREGIDSARKMRGDFDYRDGGPLDNPIEWNAGIQNFFEGAGPTTKKALSRAFSIMKDERRNPLEFGFNESGVLERLPRLRTLDYLKRGYDDLIESAMGSGNRSKAGRISNELRQLKGMLIDQNPEYAKVLAAQRDAFERTRAIELGQEIFTKMKNKPREQLRELKTLKGDKKDDARVGIIDQILNLDTKADPVTAVSAMMRNKPQREILEFAFGGTKELESFMRYVQAESKAALTDTFISSGRQSASMMLNQAGMNQREALAEIGGQAIKGYGFGGEVGFLANAIAGTRRVADSANPQLQNEIARILMSKGEDLEEGLQAAAKFFAARLKTDRSRAATTTRAVVGPVGASLGED